MPADGPRLHRFANHSMTSRNFGTSKAVSWLDRRLYPAFSDHWDDALFRAKVLDHLDPSATLLDLGAGSGIVPHMDFKHRAGLVCGLDLDPRVSANPLLHEGRVGDAERIPWPDDTFDVVVCNNVLEHLSRPAAVFREVRRCLKPGGTFLAKTPNSLHYVPLLAHCTPYAFHKWFNQKRGRASEDTFPTLYRANSSRSIHRHARSSGLTVDGIDHVEGRPEYLRFSAPSYLAGFVYERVVNRTRLLSRFRVILIAVMRKPRYLS